MELNKILESDLAGKGVLGQPDVPGLPADKMQEKIEEIVRTVAITKINEIIEYLIENGATKDDLADIVIAAGAVTSVHGRRGNVVAQKGDYTPELVGAAEEKHAATHAPDGRDPLDLNALGAAKKEHSHGNISFDGKVGNINGKVLVTGIGGLVEAKDRAEIGLVVEPAIVATSGAVSVTVENNKEYEYTGVSSLNMIGAKVSCHGTITFGDSAPSIVVSGFVASAGDKIEEAKAGETWEFDVFDGRIIWKNWSEN